MTRKRRGI